MGWAVSNRPRDLEDEEEDAEDDDDEEKRTTAVSVRAVGSRGKPITALLLAQRRMVSIAPEVGSLACFAAVSTLDLEGNQLRDLPAALAKLPSLVVLNLSHNRFTRLPDCVWAMHGLLRLDADRNRITALDVLEARRPFGGLRRLISLSLVGNGLTAVPHGIDALASLVHLDVSENPLRTLPCELARLRCLQHLVLELCPLHTQESWAASESSGTDASSTPAAIMVPSLRELAARALARVHGAAAASEGVLPANIVDFVQSADRCTECRGPFYGAPIRRVRWSQRNGYAIPWMHKLCSDHWHDDASAVAFRFQTRVPTAPRALTATENVLMIDRILGGVAVAASCRRPALYSETTTTTTMTLADSDATSLPSPLKPAAAQLNGPTSPNTSAAADTIKRFSSCTSVDSIGVVGASAPELAQTAAAAASVKGARSLGPSSGFAAYRRRRANSAVGGSGHDLASLAIMPPTSAAAAEAASDSDTSWATSPSPTATSNASGRSYPHTRHSAIPLRA